jgi:hypothetical protein
MSQSLSQLPQVPNYLPNIQSPFAAAVQGLQIGQAFGEAAGETQRRESLQSAMQAFQRNPSPQTLTPLLTSLPPQSAEVLRKHWEGMETSQRESQIAFGGQAMSTILAGRTDLAKGLFDQRAEALENAGRANEAKFFRDMAQLVEVNPQAVLGGTATLLGTADAGERMLKNILAARGAPTAERTAIAGARRGEAQATAEEAQSIFAGERAAVEVEKLQAEITNNAQRLGLDAEKARNDLMIKLQEFEGRRGQLSGESERRLNTAASESVVANQLADRLRNLSSEIQAALQQSGVTARGDELIRSVFGTQDRETLIRREYLRLRSSAVINSLPPGPASDRDIRVFMEGFLDENANPETLAAGLRGMEKVARYEAETKAMESEWIASFNGLRPATRQSTISGVRVAPGTTYTDFAKAFVENRVNRSIRGGASDAARGLIETYGR